MLLAINGATTIKAALPENIAEASAARSRALEIWAAKMDAYLAAKPSWRKQHGRLPCTSLGVTLR
jgi:hypothetical protein